VNPLYLTEADVIATFPIREAMTVVENAARALAAGAAQNRPRQRAFMGTTVLQVLAAAYGGRLGHKSYTVAPGGRGPRFWVTLYADTGEMLAIIEADAMGQLRTGSASGVATRFMAREDASILAVIGTGWQARSQMEAVFHARHITEVRAYGRDPQRRAMFCEEMSAILGTTVKPVESARAAVEGADVICTMTSSSQPVFEGAWLKPGAHVNAAGSNRANAAEIDADTVQRAAIIAVEDLAQANVEAGDLLAAEAAGVFSWSQPVLLSDIVSGATPGRTSADEITLFDSLGIGLWDVAAASYVFDACVVEGRGTRLPIPS
jgi:ornithine cyclodeaminase/alanine dehydrogenase-like protein (mu-crystallin family)